MLQPASPVLAQTVRGRVTAEGSGAAIPGAVVQLLDAQGEGVIGTLSEREGGYMLRAPRPGSYRLRVERIGFASRTSEMLELGAGAEFEYSLTVSTEPVLLAGVTARVQSRGCMLHGSGEIISRMWNEARKALNAIQISQSQELVSFDTETFRREIDPRTRRLRHEQRRSAYGATGNPFRSVPIEDLRTDGYIREFADSTVYYGPDAAVLLSDEFLRGHCFRIRDSGQDERLVGLEFTPVRGTSKADIQGVLWLDRRTAELRSVDYRYVSHGLDVPGEAAAGRIEFERVPTGAWIVRRWVIRMPLLVVKRSSWTNPVSGAVEERSQTVVEAVVENGGEVVALHDRAYGPAGTAMHTVSGVVMDSLDNQPLEGALVFLSGTSHADTTDRTGRFEIQRVAAGQYVASFIHPFLTALGVTPPQQRITLERGRDVAVDLAVPSAASILATYCPGSASPTEGMIAGYVRERPGGDPVAGARLRARWTRESSLLVESLSPRIGRSGGREVTAEGAHFDVTVQEMEVSADQHGFYRLCGVATEGDAEIDVAAAGQSRSRTIRIRLAPLVAQDLTVGTN